MSKPIRIEFWGRLQAELTNNAKADVNVTQLQRRLQAPPMAELVSRYPDWNEAMVAAQASGAYSYQYIAEYSGVHFTTVGWMVQSAPAAIRRKLK